MITTCLEFRAWDYSQVAWRTTISAWPDRAEVSLQINFVTVSYDRDGGSHNTFLFYTSWTTVKNAAEAASEVVCSCRRDGDRNPLWVTRGPAAPERFQFAPTQRVVEADRAQSPVCDAMRRCAIHSPPLPRLLIRTCLIPSSSSPLPSSSTMAATASSSSTATASPLLLPSARRPLPSSKPWLPDGRAFRGSRALSSAARRCFCCCCRCEAAGEAGTAPPPQQRGVDDGGVVCTSATRSRRRSVLGVAVGVSSALALGLAAFDDALAAGLPPEEKPKLCDAACEKDLENVLTLIDFFLKKFTWNFFLARVIDLFSG